jgi:hypothetical protein
MQRKQRLIHNRETIAIAMKDTIETTPTKPIDSYEPKYHGIDPNRAETQATTARIALGFRSVDLRADKLIRWL